MKYIINPCSGWKEEFEDEKEALMRAKQILDNDEEGIKTIHGYKDPENLIDEVWDNIEEMYESM